MSKCPYCENELHLDDFFYLKTKETKKGKAKKKIQDFKGEEFSKSISTGVKWVARMWVCPSCNKILSITEFSYRWGA